MKNVVRSTVLIKELDSRKIGKSLGGKKYHHINNQLNDFFKASLDNYSTLRKDSTKKKGQQ